MTEPELHLVRMHDGVRLATDVWLPSGRGAVARAGRVPAVLLRVPYDRAGGVAFIPALAELFAGHGFAVVGQDTRGKFGSEGIAVPFRGESADAAATLDWIAAQPWSDGRVVVAGESYGGYTAWAGAVTGHPALRGAVVRVTSTGVAREWLTLGGADRLQLIAGWVAFAWSGRELSDRVLDWDRRPLRDLLEGGDPAAIAALVGTWPADVRVPPRAPRALPVLRATVPVLHMGGWWDVFSRGQLREWSRRASSPADRLVMTPTDHTFQTVRDPGEVVPDHVMDPEVLRSVLPVLWAEVVDFCLRMAPPSGVSVARDERPPVSIGIAHGPTLALAAWPPRVRRLTLRLASPGRALLDAEGGTLELGSGEAGSVAWDHDPAHPVPSLEPDFFAPLRLCLDERPVEARPDVATFTSAVVRADVDLVGTVRLTVPVTVGARRGQLVATLTDVAPDGRSGRIVDGVATFDADGGERLVAVDLGATAYRLRAGHRLRLAIAASAHPRYAAEPGTGEDPWDAARGAVARYRIATGTAGAVLSLGVFDGAGGDRLDRAMTTGWAGEVGGPISRASTPWAAGRQA